MSEPQMGELLHRGAFWSGEFGDAYTARNRVDWRARIKFWRTVMDETGARSVYEFGCNAGWNLSAIRRLFPDVELWGHDVNERAVQQARWAGLRGVQLGSGPGLDGGSVDLAFTAGVLIHIAPDELEAFMGEVVRVSAQYVLAVEYEAEQEEALDYRGHTERLWKRPYGKLYEAMGLTQVAKWPAGAGFDNCTAWLMEKP
jgi:pseudaminic acid biosynthesis-associated methylase